MENAWIGAALAFLAGVGIAAINDRISRAVLAHSPSNLAASYVIRQMINVGYLAGLYFLSRVLPWGLIPLLIGGALGVTVPSILFALRLAKQSGKDAVKKEGEGNG